MTTAARTPSSEDERIRAEAKRIHAAAYCARYVLPPAGLLPLALGELAAYELNAAAETRLRMDQWGVTWRLVAAIEHLDAQRLAGLAERDRVAEAARAAFRGPRAAESPAAAPKPRGRPPTPPPAHQCGCGHLRAQQGASVDDREYRHG